MISYGDCCKIAVPVTKSFQRHTSAILMGANRLDAIQSLAGCLGQRLILFDCTPSTSTSEIMEQIRGSIFCEMWLCCDNVRLLKRHVWSYMASLLIHLQNLDNPSPWMELNTRNLQPQYGIMCLTRSEEDVQLIAPNLKRLVSMPIPDVKYMAHMLFADDWNKVLSCVDELLELYPQLESGWQARMHYLKQIATARRSTNLADAVACWCRTLLSAQEAPQLSTLVQQYFPGQEKQLVNWKTPELVHACQEACIRLNLQFSEAILWAVSSLLDAHRSAIPAVVFGPNLSGKTSLLRLFVETYKLEEEHRSIGSHFVCTGAYTEHILMHSTSRSVIPQLVQKIGAKESLVVLDGAFMESVHGALLSALTADRVVALRSKEQFVLPANVYFALEMNSAACISPRHSTQCRMVFLTRSHVTWSDLLKSWLTTVFASFRFLDKMLHVAVPAFVEYNSVLEHCRSGYDTIKSVHRMLQLFNGMSEPIVQNLMREDATFDNEVRCCLESMMVFAMTWTMAVPGYLDDAEKCNDYVHQMLDRLITDGHLRPGSVPPGSIYNYKLSAEGNKWTLWADDLAAAKGLPREVAINELYIRTADSCRVQHLASLFTSFSIPCVLVGEQSSGKTAMLKNYLSQHLNPAQYDVIVINVSKYMTSLMAQEILMGKMERRRQGVYGPSLGRKAVIFLDDVHSLHPACQGEQSDQGSPTGCGASLASLLKQCIEYGQIYLSSNGSVCNLIDVTFLATCNFITPVAGDGYCTPAGVGGPGILHNLASIGE